MEIDIPKTWRSGSLTQDLDFVPTGVKKFSGIKKYYSTGSIQQESYVPEGEFTYENRPSRANRIAETGDIFQARMKNTDKAILITKELSGQLFSTGFLQLRPLENNYCNKLLYYFVKSDFFINQRDELATGSTQEALTDNKAREITIPFPPEKEQQHIVAKLDALFEKIEANKKRLKKIPQLLKRLRQSVLTDAVSGRLTEDWREENTKVESVENELKKLIHKRLNQFKLELSVAKKAKLPKPSKPNYLDYSFEQDIIYNSEIPDKWLTAKVGLLCDCIVPGRDKPKSFTGYIPWITPPEIKSDEIDDHSSNLKLSEKEISAVKGRIIPMDSVIMCCVGRFGISAIAKVPVVINQQLHAFIKSEIILPKYLMYHLRTLENYQNEIATSTTIAYLNKNNCNSMPINLPPLDEQKEIVKRIEELFAFADRIESRYTKAKAMLDKLPQTILAKAFRGELLVQDLEDVPVSVLLEKMKKEQPSDSDITKRKAAVKK